MDNYIVYADGACSGNGREYSDGGWGAVIIGPKDGEDEISGFWGSNATNNKMELLAVIQGIKQVPVGSRIKVLTDSQYVVKTMTESWKRNANEDLWYELDRITLLRTVTYHWIKGHAGDEYQERADQLARQEIRANRLG